MEPTPTSDSRSLADRVPMALARLRADMLLACLDANLAVMAFVAALLIRFEGDVPSTFWDRTTAALPLVVGVALAAAWLCGLYGQIWQHASMIEARRLLLAGVVVLVVHLLLRSQAEDPLPLSVIVFGAGFTTALQGGVRFHARLFALHRRNRDDGGTRVIVLGAGVAGAALVRDMVNHPQAGLLPVALLDDDVRKQGRRCFGVRVMGSIYELESIACSTHAHQVILAVTSAPGDLVSLVSDLADKAGLALRVIPTVRELVGHGPTVQDVRDLRIEDLLGRKQVETDLLGVRSLLTGRRVLITGAGGSIGSEIARQVSEFRPARLLLLDNDETHVHDVAATVEGSCVQLLVDVRDRLSVFRAFAEHRPEVVFHAAAHKHVPLLESHPCEAVKTNVGGTLNLTDAAVTYGVDRFIFISTDKAVRPRGVMGASKALGEQIVLKHGKDGRRYSAVRFGNVLGSRGSVIPTFMQQIQSGGPVTITDPRMTRYFMSIPEAVQLVLQSASMVRGGELYMLDMGEPVRIVDLAQRMIRLSGRRVGADIELRVTGVRPGEKLEESLHTAAEQLMPTVHPSIIQLRPVPLDPAALAQDVRSLVAVAGSGRDTAVRDGLFAIVEQRQWLINDALPPPAIPSQPLVIDLFERDRTWTSSTT